MVYALRHLVALCWQKVARGLRDPLLLFVMLGIMLYLGSTWWQSRPQPVLADRTAMLNFIQQRSNNFDLATATARWDAASDEERQSLVQAYLNEEVLYREALALGYLDGDYVIKRRLVQKMEQMLTGFAEQQTNLADADIRQCFATRKAEFHQPARYSFGHVFLGQSPQPADALLTNLNTQNIPATWGNRYGQRFAYHSVYVARDATFINSHFGAAFTNALSSLELDQWHGPIRSEHGLHLVRLTAASAAVDPPLSAIYEKVKQTCTRAHTQQLVQEAIRQLTLKHTTQHNLPL